MKLFLGACLMGIATAGGLVALSSVYLLPAVRGAVAEEVAAQLEQRESGRLQIPVAREPHTFPSLRRAVDAGAAVRAARRAAEPDPASRTATWAAAGPEAEPSPTETGPLELEQVATIDGRPCMLLRQPGHAGGAVVRAIPRGCEDRLY